MYYPRKKFGKHYYEALTDPETQTEAQIHAIRVESRGYFARLIKRSKNGKVLYQVYIRRKMSLKDFRRRNI